MKSCPRSRYLLVLSAAGCQRVYLARLSAPQSPESIGEADTPASARPITSLALHIDAGDAMGLFSSSRLTNVLPTTTHPTSPNSFSVSWENNVSMAHHTALHCTAPPRNLYNNVLSGTEGVFACSFLLGISHCLAHAIGFERLFYLGPVRWWCLESAGACTFALFVLCTGEAWVRASYWQHVGTLTCVGYYCTVHVCLELGWFGISVGGTSCASYMYGDGRGGLRFAIDRNRGFVTVGVGGRRGCFSCPALLTHHLPMISFTL